MKKLNLYDLLPPNSSIIIHFIDRSLKGSYAIANIAHSGPKYHLVDGSGPQVFSPYGYIEYHFNDGKVAVIKKVSDLMKIAEFYLAEENDDLSQIIKKVRTIAKKREKAEPNLPTTCKDDMGIICRKGDYVIFNPKGNGIYKRSIFQVARFTPKMVYLRHCKTNKQIITDPNYSVEKFTRIEIEEGLLDSFKLMNWEIPMKTKLVMVIDKD